MLLIVIIPVFILQFMMQKESLELIFKMTGKLNLTQTLDSQLDFIKKMAKQNPENKDKLKIIFNKMVEKKKDLHSLFLTKNLLLQDIQKQSILNALVISTISLFLALLISWTIVKHTRSLWNEKQEALLKIERLQNLESWQQMARMLIHELRHPITPVKLVNSKMIEKYEKLDKERFQDFLKQSTDLVTEQIQNIEEMINSFASLGKLPKPKLQKVELTEFYRDFKERYQGVWGDIVHLRFPSQSISARFSYFDTKLIRDVIFNLMKNAVEANEKQEMTINISLKIENKSLAISVQNHGKLIPNEIAKKIFDPYQSTKASSGKRFNMGLGLTIAQKIACDHGGNLYLKYNDKQHGVVFVCQIPHIVKMETA